MVKNLTYFVLFFSAFLLFTQSASAGHPLKRVLGESTQSASPQLPPTSEGPGFILPDSPFFFLDNIKQEARLFLAFSSEKRAEIRTEIAGERLAELRVMLAKNKSKEARSTLSSISDNLEQASDELSKASLTGKDLTKIAKIINDSIKRKQDDLDVLEQSSSGELSALVDAAQASILQSKLEVEESLSEEDHENEIRDDLNRFAKRKARRALGDSSELQLSLEELYKDASETAEELIEKREEALKRAVGKRSEAAKKVQERLLENEKKRQERLLEVQKKAVEQSREALEKAREAARGFEKAQEETDRIRHEDASATSSDSFSDDDHSES